MFRLGVVSFLGGQTEDETMQRKTCATILTAEEPYTPIGESKRYSKKMHYIFDALRASKKPAA